MYKTAITMFASLLTAFSVGGCAGDKGDSYRVEDVGGVPRLMFNGEPVRPRMLYVSPTYFMLGSPTRRNAAPYAYTAWTDTFIEIPAMKSAVPNGEIHMNLGKTPFEYKIAGLEIAEYPSGKKVYEIDFKNRDKRVKIYRGNRDKSELSFEQADGAGNVLRVANSAKEEFILAFGDVKLEAGKVYHINVKIKSKRGNDFETYLAADGKLVEPKVRSFVGVQTAIAKDAGVDIITFPVQAADLMPKDGKSYDFNKLKGALDEIVAANPNAKILLRIRFYPPQWWLDKYSDDVMTRENGGKCEFPCVSSQRYREDSAKVLKMFIDYCEKNYGKNIIGYHPGGGNSCEWFYGNSWSSQWYGYNKSAVEAWKKWVAKKYKNDAALKEAWNDPSASLASVDVPSVKEREAAQYVINPKTQMKLADYNIFLQDEMVDMVEYLAKVIRKEVPNKLSVLFYGYTCEFSVAHHKGPASTGHYALWRIANSPYFDMFSGPVSYRERNLGEPGFVMGAAETITRCGKIWLDEDDIRTHRTPQTQQKITGLGMELRKQADTIQVLQRDMARQAIRNHGCWWMDLSGTGWYDDPEVWKLMPKFAEMEKDIIENPIPYNPEIAVITDERSVYYAGAKGASSQTTRALHMSRVELGRCAAPLGYYLFDDFMFGKPLDAKLYVFPIEYALDAKQRKHMRAAVKDAAAIFVWAPAYIDLDKGKFSRKAVEEATGFEVEKIKEDISARVMPTDEGKKFGLDKIFGYDKKVKPLLTPVLKEGDKVLAVYENDKPAFVLRGKHLFCGVADIPLELYWNMAKLSGAHMYAQKYIGVYANGGYVSVTCLDESATPTDIEIDVNSDREIFDALSGEKLGKGPKITLKMKRGDNRVLRLGKGNADFKK